MRGMMVFATGVCAIWLTGLLLRLPAKRVALPVLAYMFCHMARVVGGWFFLQRVPLESPAYAMYYAVAAIPVLLAALVLTSFYIVDLGKIGLILFVASLNFAATVCTSLALLLKRPLPPTIRWHFIIAGVLLACGISLLLSLAHPSGDVETLVKIGLGAYWLAQSGVMICYSLAQTNGHLGWAVKHQWLPSFVALVAMTWLICHLSGGQAEAAKQLTPEFQKVEREVRA